MTDYKEVQLGPKTVQIPQEWEVQKLQEVTSRLTNGTSESQNTEGKGLSVTRIETISHGSIDYSKVGFVDSDKDLSEYKMQPNDILYSHINSLKHIGKTAQYEGLKELHHGMNLILLRPENIQPDLLLQYLKSEYARKIARSWCKQAVGQASINQTELGAVPIIYPPKNEQQRIAEILTTIDDLIEKTERVIQQTQRVKKGLMQDLLTKGIGHTEFKEVQLGPKTVQIPKEWEVRKLDAVTHNRGTYGANESAQKDLSEGFKYVRITDINAQGKINEPDTKIPNEGNEKYELKNGDILYARSGSPGLCYHHTKGPGYAYAGYLIKYTPKTDDVVPEYIHHYSHSKLFKDWANSQSRGTTLSNLNATELRNSPLIYPPLQEQERIAEILTTIDEKIQREKEERDKLQHLKKGLMQDLLTGKTRV